MITKPIDKEFNMEEKRSPIDALFDEEVKPMDISLSSEFNSVISDLNSNVSSDDTPTSQRNVASETMMTDKPIAKEIFYLSHHMLFAFQGVHAPVLQ